MISTALTTAFLAVFATTAAAALAWVEMRAAKMGCGVIVCPVPFTVAASFAVREETFVGRDIYANPDLADGRVDAVDVSAQFVLAVEALWLVVADMAVCLYPGWALDRGFRDGGDFFGCAVGG
jgi:hypothetical protein